jgi:hypothetical protein
MATIEDESREATNGAALAAFMAAGIGAFAIGFFVIIHEAGFFSAPALYAPAGGLSGRTTFAAVTWLTVWAALHVRWKNLQIQSGRVYTATLVTTALGILLCFPLFWRLVH